MVKCLTIGKNIGKPIYRSISTLNFLSLFFFHPSLSGCLFSLVHVPPGSILKMSTIKICLPITQDFLHHAILPHSNLLLIVSCVRELNLFCPSFLYVFVYHLCLYCMFSSLTCSKRTENEFKCCCIDLQSKASVSSANK